jgi:type I restriction enzyme R subunit
MSGHNLIQAVNRVATVFKDKPSGLIVDYIGIGDRLRDATKKYTGGGGKGQVTIDVKEALEMAIDEVNLLKTVLPKGFDYTVWPSLSKGDQLKLVSSASNHIVADDDICNDFLLHEKRLSSIVPVIKSEQGVEEIALEIIFFQHVAAAVRKVKFPPTPLRKKEQQIKDLIHRSIESDDVIDVFEMAGIERFDISIINDDFLATAKEQKSGNELKLELIRQILEDEIKVRSYKNLIKSKKLKEEVDKIITITIITSSIVLLPYKKCVK